MEFGKRLKTLRLDKNLTQKGLASSVGVSTATVQFWENDTKKPSMGAIVSLCAALGCSADALLGINKPRAESFSFLSRSEKSLVDDYRNLDSHGKRLVLTVCKMEKARTPEDHTDEGTLIPFPGRTRERFIPRYTTPSAAGISVPLDGSDFEMMLVTEDMPTDADCAVNIQGNSMAPYIHDGDMVYVKKDVKLSEGDVGIFCVDGAMYCKQYHIDKAGDLILVSANPNLRHTNVHVAADGGQSVTVFGKVLLGYKIDLPSYLFEELE